MRVGVVGAGVAGLAAARTLARDGHEILLFEKEGTVGGRVATLRQGAFIWDTGATSIAPRGKAIEDLMLRELDVTDLVRVEKPIYLHSSLHIERGDPKRHAERYTYRGGIDTLPRLLAEGLEVRHGCRAEGIERTAGGYSFCGEDFDAVVLTPPVPQASALLWSVGESRALAHTRYRPCLSVLLGFDATLPRLPYHALLDPRQRHPLTWLSVESEKSPGRAPEGGTALGAQLSAEYSLLHYTWPDEEIVQATLLHIARLYGPSFATPVATAVKRWKYSQPTATADFDNVNPPGSRLIVAGDGLAAGRVEEAYESGLRAARLLLEER